MNKSIVCKQMDMNQNNNRAVRVFFKTIKFTYEKNVIFVFFLLAAQFCFGQNEVQLFSNSTIDLNNPQIGQSANLEIEWEVCTGRVLRPSSFPDYDSIAEFIHRFPKICFIIESHTDCRSDSIYNIELTRRRADSICAYIHRRHNLSNVKCIGKGENEPLNDCRCESNFISRRCMEE